MPRLATPKMGSDRGAGRNWVVVSRPATPEMESDQELQVIRGPRILLAIGDHALALNMELDLNLDLDLDLDLDLRSKDQKCLDLDVDVDLDLRSKDQIRVDQLDQGRARSRS